MSRPREHNPVSLFPFLAVLVCAMGALILLLLVTTRRIRSQAVARAWEAAQSDDDRIEPGAAEPALPVPDSDEIALPVMAQRDDPAPEGRSEPEPTPSVATGPPVEAPRPPPRPIDPNPALRERIAALTAERERRSQQLQRLNGELNAAREQAGTLDGRLATAGERLQEIGAERERARRAVAELEERQRRLAAQIHEVDRRIAQARQQPAAAASKFVVVPYDGVSGTNRRPILVEFTGEGIRFIPENVLLKKEDFDGFTPGYNPLLAGARVLVDYWTDQSRRSAGDEPPPYVLLIVRPSGVPYYPLRLLLDRLGQPFGYELLEEDQELAVPEVDPAAAEVCRITVERLLQQRDALLQVVRAGREPGVGGTAAGMRPGDGGLGDWPSGPAMSDTVGSGGASEGGLGGTTAFGGSTTAGQRQGPVFRGYQRPSYDLVEPDSGIVLSPGQRRPRAVQLPGGHRGGGPGAIVEQSSPMPAPPGTSSGRANGAANAAASSAAGGSGWLAYQTAERSTANDSQFDALGAVGSPPGRDPSGLGQADSPIAGVENPGTVVPNGTPSGTQPGESMTGAANAAGSVADGSTGPPQPTGFAAVNSTPAGRAASTRSSDASAPGSSAGGAAGPAGPQPLTMPKLMLPAYSMRNAEFSDAKPHRRRWGLSSPRATIGFERELRVDVTSDRLIVGGDQTIPAGDGETRDELVSRMVGAVEAAARSWGPPPEAFYWIPSLRFRVSPGGNLHYERLRGPLREWGLASSATYTLDAPSQGDPFAPRVDAPPMDASTRGASRLHSAERVMP